MKRRTFIEAMLLGAGSVALGTGANPPKRPNLVFVFGDQWRAQACGYAGDRNVATPNLDKLESQCVNFTHAVSGCPVCSPYRASLMTGQYWHTHGVFLNDVPLKDEAVTIAEALRDSGYDTGYIGKWHLDGRGRSSYTPPERRQGFEFWKALECSHDYNNSMYFDDSPQPKKWQGYDAVAQTREAQKYIRQHSQGKPFALFLSWGPPHNPYETAPKEFVEKVPLNGIALRPNVPQKSAEQARKDLQGYYAHIMAMDACVATILETLAGCGIADDTIFVFTSDHGDMLHSHGLERKQKPYDESLRVPFLLRYPRALGAKNRRLDWMMNTPDIMPTLLGLCGVAIPESVEGTNLAPNLIDGTDPKMDAALLACIAPSGEWTRARGGMEYRGVRTPRYTYVRGIEKPWLLFDNEKDPYQHRNLCGQEQAKDIQQELETTLQRILKERGDKFEPADAYIKRWGYVVDATGTVPIRQ